MYIKLALYILDVRVRGLDYLLEGGLLFWQTLVLSDLFGSLSDKETRRLLADMELLRLEDLNTLFAREIIVDMIQK